MINETMAVKKKASERREEHLAIRLTKAEAARLDEVGKLFPEIPRATLLRMALMNGLDGFERDGITMPPTKPRR